MRWRDARWTAGFSDIELLINPNGPLLNGGSDGDNGQTGRKLVVDYYGPRVPIGGGALSGKDLSHIDRAGAYAAREAALHAVRTGAGECRVTLAYAPNRDVPLDVVLRHGPARRALQTGVVLAHCDSRAVSNFSFGLGYILGLRVGRRVCGGAWYRLPLCG